MASPKAPKKRGHDGTEEVQPPPAKRGRGRPRKDPNAPPKHPKDPNAPKRGRGRPRKDPNAAPIAKPKVPGRGPGRPKKDSTAPTAAPSKSKSLPKVSTTTTSKSKVSSTRSTSAPNTTLAQFVGTYDITCEEVEDNWPDAADDMTLSIHPLPRTKSALIACFNLGILEGTMLIAADKKTLERVHKQVAATDSVKSDKSAVAVPKGGTLYFVWRGQNIGDDDQVHTGNGGQQSGTLKFNAEDMSFKGVGSFPALGAECSFIGTKISNEASDEPEPWSNYSEEAYEEANEQRWG
ncbi:hypothetical protein BDV96DRAFT_285852 [Lophiotrema nucula]|uniref:AT hook motif-containing protein n=1 Tax=Lophiotrema nucula TaxID=690887 RepID=A0A6A5YLV1_9PLEO|nr:hypothetical protein BDV96DRAFT_285852 [Lophiotrema nucula]